VKRLKQRVTKDNSITLFNEEYQEYYHSIHGAIEEAFEKFVKPCKIAELAKTGKIKILDICFGMGYNSADYDLINRNKIDKRVKLKIILGDAKEKIKELNEKFDAVFLDPFSPQVCPKLWTKEFFAEIKQVMKDSAILATYSCARLVRDNLKANNFIVKDGPCVGRRGPCTIATLK